MVVFWIVLALGAVLGAAVLVLALGYVNHYVFTRRELERSAQLAAWAAEHGWTHRTRAWQTSPHPWTPAAAERAGVDGDPQVDHVLEGEQDGLPIVVLQAWTPRRDHDTPPMREVRGRVDLPLACAPVLINPERRRPERRVHLLDDELDERWWIESDDAVAADELLLGAHAHLRATVLPPGWRVTIDGRGPAAVWRGELTPTAAEGVCDLLVGLAEALPEPARRPAER